ncbi:heavy metal translocating P-type ATPase [Phocaeicola oris]|uniref:heavy metal translocating P-type ATPase n=1 Tax=Phocaeicola oris TaxID=2896850 RepID=UPI00234F65E5|nr:heavy metal translocating P-type ATPase [Phocaeicola oris]MCE2616906.1 heavy metal translocating P-type ATPase [Phocaeicola oris]
MNTSTMIKKTFPVLGMSCASCALRVDKTLNKQQGVCKATVNFANGMATVSYDSKVTSPDVLRAAVLQAGYDLYIDKNDSIDKLENTRKEHYRSQKHRTIGAFTLAVPITVLMLLFKDETWVGVIAWLLATIVVFWLGRSFFINAWKQLKHHSANMDTLVAGSTGIAYLFSLFNLLFPQVWLSRGVTPHIYFDSAGMIIGFILLGRLLEARAKGNTATAIKRLMGLRPKTITVIRNGEEHLIPIERIQHHDIVWVKPGERIAVDGVVTEGSSYVDESMLSGEPVPVAKGKGEKVFAGTLNGRGSFRFQAEQVGTDTLLAKIIRMVQDAQGSKAPVQQLVDRVAAVFVPAIMIIALIALIAWVILDHANGISHGMLALVTVLIIACPCALGLATPTAIMVGIGKGAERGILIKDAESLEVARKVNVVVLDKTGTITEGKPEVIDMRWVTENNRLKQALVSLEKHSEHPLAEAVVRYMNDVSSVDVIDFNTITGKGAKGSVNGITYYIGNKSLLNDARIAVLDHLDSEADKWMKRAETVVWFADEKQVLAIIGISDKIKESSVKAVKMLQDKGIDVFMLTGDNESTAKEVARQSGIRHYRSGVLPGDKASFVKELQQQGKCVAMVGDGINDSAALAQSDLSIAMGNGSDIAMDVAKMTIISSDLTKISEALTLSKLTTRTICENLFWAFFYNLIAVPIAAGVLYPINGFLLNPMIGGAAMAFSSVSVVTNSLLLKWKKIGKKDPKEEKTESFNYNVMKKEFKVEGMMCQHCRMHVEKALNSMEGVKATVTLTPPVATVEFEEGKEKSLAELQKVVTEEAGDYQLDEWRE